jgi:uncharacterized membrane protein HdeD (DUF308 family)
MTDPRIDPAGTPGQVGGPSPSGSSGRQTRHGLFHRGGQARQGSAGSSTGSTATATRTTSTTGTTVPQQTGQAPAEQAGHVPASRAPYRDEYGYETGQTGDPGARMLASAANKSWPALILASLGMIALGILLLVWPHASLTVVAILIGAALVVSGLVKLWEGFTAQGDTGGKRAAYIVIGLVAAIAGIYCLRHHALSLYLVAFVTGVYFIMHGFADLGVAFSARGGGRGLRAVLGIFSLAAGLIMVIWPGITLVLLLTLVAAWLLFYGVVVGALAFSVRKEAKALTERSKTTTMTAPRTA